MPGTANVQVITRVATAQKVPRFSSIPQQYQQHNIQSIKMRNFPHTLHSLTPEINSRNDVRKTGI